MPYIDFRAIKARVSILDVLNHYDLKSKLKRSGNTLTGTCPVHQGASGNSFRVSLDKNCFICFSCKVHGDQLDLVVALEKCSLQEAVHKMEEWLGPLDVESSWRPIRFPT